jgi:hypothetical protein
MNDLLKKMAYMIPALVDAYPGHPSSWMRTNTCKWGEIIKLRPGLMVGDSLSGIQTYPDWDDWRLARRIGHNAPQSAVLWRTRFETLRVVGAGDNEIAKVQIKSIALVFYWSYFT